MSFRFGPSSSPNHTMFSTVSFRNYIVVNCLCNSEIHSRGIFSLPSVIFDNICGAQFFSPPSCNTSRFRPSFPRIFRHFVRRFWNHVFTWRSVRCNSRANSFRPSKETYFEAWKVFSKINRCLSWKGERLFVLEISSFSVKIKGFPLYRYN